MPLNRFDVVMSNIELMSMLLLVRAHVFFECFDCSRRLSIVIKLTMLLHLGVLHALNETLNSAFFLKDVKAHFEDVMHFKLVPEALFLEVRVDVAKSLAARRVLHSHLNNPAD